MVAELNDCNGGTQGGEASPATATLTKAIQQFEKMAVKMTGLLTE